MHHANPNNQVFRDALRVVSEPRASDSATLRQLAWAALTTARGGRTRQRNLKGQTMKPQFFMVCRAPSGPHAKTEPKHRYATESEAETIARRLAREHGAPFVILAPIKTITPKSDQQGALL